MGAGRRSCGSSRRLSLVDALSTTRLRLEPEPVPGESPFRVRVAVHTRNTLNGPVPEATGDEHEAERSSPLTVRATLYANDRWIVSRAIHRSRVVPVSFVVQPTRRPGRGSP